MYLELLLLAARRTFGADDTTQERRLRTFFVPAIVAADRVVDLVAPAVGPAGNRDGKARRLAARGGNRG